MSDDNEIFVVYEGREEKFDIEDLDPEVLKQVFGLDFTPLTLKHEMSRKNVVIKNKGKLIAGDYYRILPNNIHREKPQSAWEESSIKSRLQNAVVASKAAYLTGVEECLNFLNKNIQNHNLKNVFQSQDDKCSFIVAEDVDCKDVYISFRGTQSVDDWKENMKAFRVNCGIKGKFHAGFLSRANIFPLQKILNEKTYTNSNIIFCGHSMGGAVATIVAIFALLEEKKRRSFQEDQDQRSVKCFTFGAPMVGDCDLEMFCNERGISKHLYHSVNFLDPVPRLLSYSMCLKAMATQLNTQVKTIVNTFATKEGAEYFCSNKNALIDMKTDFVNKLSNIAPIIQQVLETCCLFSQSNTLTFAVGVAKMVKDVIDSVQNQNSATVPNSGSVYATIGNFLFLNETKEKCVTAEYKDDKEIEKNLDVSGKPCFSEETPCVVEHSVDRYEYCLSTWGTPKGKFPMFILKEHFDQEYAVQVSVPRRVNEKKCYTPEIQDAELIKVCSEEKGERLQLRLTGPNLFHVVLDKCNFDFGFPFAKNPELFQIKQVVMSEHIDSVILEEDFVMMPNMADCGSRIQLTTVFGKCEHYLMKDKLRNLAIPSLNQLSHHDSVSRVIKMAIQRGMGITQIIRQSNHTETQEQLIITKVKSLANFCLPEKEKAQLIKMFDDPKQNQFILSNEEEYKKIQSLCDKVSLYLKSPVKLKTEPSIAKKFGIGLSAIIGGALMAIIAGPGLVMLGTIEAVSLAATSAAGVIGFAGAGYVANSLLDERLVDQVYHEFLQFIVNELFKTWQLDNQQKNAIKYQEISDYRMEGKTYSLEKALLLMYDKEKKWENFRGTILSECKASSQESLLKRIDCIAAIHNIRNLLATQCYIGVVGIQDAGKTTLLNKIWGIEGKSGLFTHTEVPINYQINEKVYVVDFPGSNSLDYHSKTFSICGAMNNLILVVIPFTGDINQIISKEISKVFKVMHGSDCTQVILCINKCGPFVNQIREELRIIRNEPEKETDPQWIKDFKLGKTGMADSLAQKYSDKLNDHYEQSGNNTKIRKEDILFTDWLVEDVEDAPGDFDRDHFHLSGVKEIKKRIGEYLLKYKIYAKHEKEELEACLNSKWKK